MFSTTHFHQGYPPYFAADDQGEYVFAPSIFTTTPTPNLTNTQTLNSTCPSAGSLYMAANQTASVPPGMWGQLPAVPTPLISYGLDEFFEEEFNLEQALQLDAYLNGPPLPIGSRPSLATEATLSGCMPEMMSSYPAASPDSSVFNDGRQVRSPSSGSSSLGSPTLTMTPFTAPLDTPCSTPPTPKELCCSEPTCFETFTKTDELNTHQRKHKQQRFRCDICGKPHSDRRALDRHLWSRHKDYAMRTGAKSEAIKCRVCVYESRADNVRRHEKTKHGLDSRAAARRY